MEQTQKVKVKCAACGRESERSPKPAPKNQREGNTVYFICPCGAYNLRNGTARLPGKKEQKPQVEPKEVQGNVKEEKRTEETDEYGFGYF